MNEINTQGIGKLPNESIRESTVIEGKDEGMAGRVIAGLVERQLHFDVYYLHKADCACYMTKAGLTALVPFVVLAKTRNYIRSLDRTLVKHCLESHGNSYET